MAPDAPRLGLRLPRSLLPPREAGRDTLVRLYRFFRPAMRPLGLCLLGAFTACATSPPGVDPDWRVIQAGRLERFYEPRRPADAVAALVAQDPKPATGRREGHIDQREPAGLRRFREPTPGWLASVGVGVGNLGVRVKGTQLDDRVASGFFRAALESPDAPGIHLEAWSSESDLFAGRRINDGVDPVAADAQVAGVHVFPHLRLAEVREGAFVMPVRLGLFGEWQRMAHDLAVEREWLSLGPRLLMEPTLRLVGDDGGWVDVFGRFGGEVAPAWFREEFRGGDDHDVTTRWSGQLGFGLRGHIGRMEAELGYDLHHSQLGSVDSSLLGDRGRTDLQRQQLWFGLGIRF